MFLSRLNEIKGGCEKILPVSLSFWSNLKFFQMMFLAARFMWMVSECKWNSLSFFPSVTFAVLNVDQSVEYGVEPC